MNIPANLEERLLRHSERITETGCLIWLGHLMWAGYGHIQVNRRPMRTHRAAWLCWRGPIKDGSFVLHRCDVRCCINPHHLFLGTHTDNMRDASNKNRLVTGEQWSAVRPALKLSPNSVRKIRADTRTNAAVANDYDVSDTTISAVRLFQKWAWVK
jgi:hypothetical protein